MSAAPKLTVMDAVVLLVAAISVALAFRGGGGVLLRPSWSQAANNEMPLPQPLVTDLDGDGVAEVVLATSDGHIIVISPTGGVRPDTTMQVTDAGTWRSLPAQHTASLRSHTGLATGRRPLALAAGLLSGRPGPDGNMHRIVVALTEDWTVLAFDHQLRLLWEHSVAGGISVRGAASVHDEQQSFRHEVALLVSPHSIYDGDHGVVIVGGRTERQDRGTTRLQTSNQGADGAPSAPSQLSNDAAVGSGHFDYVALEGGSGARRWSHRMADFHHALHGDEQLTPQMDYRLDLDSLGGGTGGIDGRHEGERPWRAFRESIMAQLPTTWRHPHDTSLRLARFDRAKRPMTHERKQRASATGAILASGASSLEVIGSRLLATTSEDGSVVRAQSATVDETRNMLSPNVLVAVRRHGIEVLHLFTGRPLTHVALDSSAVHGDVDGDGTIDHVSGLSSEATEALYAESGRHDVNNDRKHQTKRNRKKNRHAFDKPTCLGTCSSGLPIREELWNASICGDNHGIGRRKHRKHANSRVSIWVAKPLLIARNANGAADAAGSATLDAYFLSSDGRVTCLDAAGKERWTVATDAGWRLNTPGDFLPSLSKYNSRDSGHGVLSQFRTPTIIMYPPCPCPVLASARARLEFHKYSHRVRARASGCEGRATYNRCRRVECLHDCYRRSAPHVSTATAHPYRPAYCDRFFR
jgi:outer membrane protein assembly factor BamB